MTVDVANCSCDGVGRAVPSKISGRRVTTICRRVVSRCLRGKVPQRVPTLVGIDKVPKTNGSAFYGGLLTVPRGSDTVCVKFSTVVRGRHLPCVERRIGRTRRTFGE